MNEIAKSFRKKRKMEGKTVFELAVELELSIATINRIESGKNVGPRAMKKIAEYLKLDVFEVIEKYEDNK